MTRYKKAIVVDDDLYHDYSYLTLVFEYEAPEK